MTLLFKFQKCNPRITLFLFRRKTGKKKSPNTSTVPYFALRTPCVPLIVVGSAVLATTFPELGIGFVGVCLAFGLTVLTAAYALGHISGGHFNPAISIGLWAGARFEAKELAPYIISQIIGATLAALV